MLSLQEEYALAWAQDTNADKRIAAAEDIRYNRWAGQSSDGLKHQELMPEGKRALPYDRAPDTRVPFTDGTIQTLVDVDYTSFWNSRVKAAPAAATRLTAMQAGELRTLISWMIHGPLRAGLIDQVEFASQVKNTIGWVVLHPIWRKRTQLRMQRLTLEMIAAAATAAPMVAQLPTLIADPTTEEEAATVLVQFFPNLKVERARQAIKDLREKGEADFPVPEQESNVPELEVLVPWQDVVLPAEAASRPENARMIFRRVFLTAEQARERAREEEWDGTFLSELLKTEGTSSGYGTSPEQQDDVNSKLIEVVYAYSTRLDADDVPGKYCTVFSPNVKTGGDNTPLYGADWLVDYAHGQYPFVMATTEVIGRRPSDARGVPEVLGTGQREMKQQRDGTYVYSQLSITPPLQKRGTQASKLPPELGPLGIINNVAGEWSWFPPPPGKPEIAFKLIEDIRREGEDYYGIPRADTPSMRWQPRQQRQAMRWLGKWAEALWQLAVLAYQHLSPEELYAVLGRAPVLNADTVAKHRLLLWFDTRAMDPAWVESLLQAISQMILPADAAGVIDRAKLIQFAMAYLEPTLAEEVTSDQEGAKQAIFKGVRDEIAAIMLGNEGMYVENDPTAKSKLMFAQQIVQANPDYQQVLQTDPRKRELLEKWTKNLTMSVMQEQNKTIGRLGIKPGHDNAQS